MHHNVNNIMNSNDPLISVIVPIYNVEPYVRKCLDSLQNQTMKQIEIICIDDGSTDKSGEIAEEYTSTTSPAFRVIHTENRGLSAARNRGIDEARAPWIMFVDSDDWVDSRFCELPYRAAMENDADLVIFNRYVTTKQQKVKKEHRRIIPEGRINREEAIDVGESVAWNKLYHTKLFEQIRYPEGYVYEDLATTHKLVYRAKLIVSIRDSLYYKRDRKDSICHIASNDKDRFIMSWKRYDELVELGYPRQKAQNHLIETALRCNGRSSNNESELFLETTEFLKHVKGMPERLSAKSRIKLMLWRINKSLYRTIYSLFC